jgi:hypothetical protein
MNDRVKRFYEMVDQILAAATARENTSLEGREPPPGGPAVNYYRVHWTAVLDPDNMPEAAEVCCPFCGQTERVPEFIAEAISLTSGVLCINTEGRLYESSGYLAFATLEQATNALSVLRVLAREHVFPTSPYGYVEMEISLCLPASFAAPPSVGPGSRIERVQFCRRQQSEN